MSLHSPRRCSSSSQSDSTLSLLANFPSPPQRNPPLDPRRARRHCTDFGFRLSDEDSLVSTPDSSSLSDIHFDFPEPPAGPPVVRRMKSSPSFASIPWEDSDQLEFQGEQLLQIDASTDMRRRKRIGMISENPSLYPREITKMRSLRFVPEPPPQRSSPQTSEQRSLLRGRSMSMEFQSTKKNQQTRSTLFPQKHNHRSNLSVPVFNNTQGLAAPFLHNNRTKSIREDPFPSLRYKSFIDISPEQPPKKTPKLGRLWARASRTLSKIFRDK